MPGTAAFIARQIDEICLAGIVRMDAALHADFGRAALPRLLRAARDLVEREIVGPAAQILAELALREGAELAAEVADVGVVDVAVDDIASRGRCTFLARSASAASQTAMKVVAARREQIGDVGFGQAIA